jgi:hypothetical protein
MSACRSAGNYGTQRDSQTREPWPRSGRVGAFSRFRRPGPGKLCDPGLARRLAFIAGLMYAGGMAKTTTYIFTPVGMDRFSPHAGTPAAGTRVVKTQPAGCPRNGTMGHCYVADAETGDFYGLVLVNSLVKT